MPRITVLAERKMVNRQLEELEIEDKYAEYVWKYRSILTEDIAEYEEDTDVVSFITLYSGVVIYVQEPFEALDLRIKEAEEAYNQPVDSSELAEEIARNLTIISFEEEGEDEEEEA